jgi:hypothetical protein
MGNNKIFIQIASYRDPQLIPTIKDCIAKARNPKNGKEVSVGERYAIYFRTGKELRERVNKKPVIS